MTRVSKSYAQLRRLGMLSPATHALLGLPPGSRPPNLVPPLSRLDIPMSRKRQEEGAGKNVWWDVVFPAYPVREALQEALLCQSR